MRVVVANCIKDLQIRTTIVFLAENPVQAVRSVDNCTELFAPNIESDLNIARRFISVVLILEDKFLLGAVSVRIPQDPVPFGIGHVKVAGRIHGFRLCIRVPLEYQLVLVAAVPGKRQRTVIGLKCLLTVGVCSFRGSRIRLRIRRPAVKIPESGQAVFGRKITFPDIEDCLILVTSSFSTRPSYANQTKKAITNTFIADAMNEFLKNQLEYFFAENPADADRFCNQVLVNKRSREQAENTRLDLKKKLSSGMDAAHRVEKFVACRSKDPELREVYIVEGDSAMTSCKLARNADFQAIIPVRGKTLNCMKASYDRIFKSDIILDLLRVIGCGVELSTRKKTDMAAFDLANLRWSKIIICTDADEDGFQIRTLLLTLFYRLLPTLLKEGRVYIAESPLYEIKVSGRDSEYAYNEPEKARITARLDGEKKKYTLQRSKGLGENSADMMAKTTMNPATRRLIRVTPAEAEATARMFDLMLGDDLPGRKRYIADHGAEYLQMADI